MQGVCCGWPTNALTSPVATGLQCVGVSPSQSKLGDAWSVVQFEAGVVLVQLQRWLETLNL